MRSSPTAGESAILDVRRQAQPRELRPDADGDAVVSDELVP
jgi:hypothetical protein